MFAFSIIVQSSWICHSEQISEAIPGTLSLLQSVRSLTYQQTHEQFWEDFCFRVISYFLVINHYMSSMPWNCAMRQSYSAPPNLGHFLSTNTSLPDFLESTPCPPSQKNGLENWPESTFWSALPAQTSGSVMYRNLQRPGDPMPITWETKFYVLIEAMQL